MSKKDYITSSCSQAAARARCSRSHCCCLERRDDVIIVLIVYHERCGCQVTVSWESPLLHQHFPAAPWKPRHRSRRLAVGNNINLASAHICVTALCDL